MRILTCILSFIALAIFFMGTRKEKTVQVVFLSGCNEYVSHISLKKYKDHLEKSFAGIKIVLIQADGTLNKKDEYSALKGTEALNDCDVLLVFTRRTTISGKAMEDIKKYVQSGKPLVALRSSSHGFESWPEFDKEVLGGNYSNHFKGTPEKRQIGVDGIFYPVGEPSGPLLNLLVNTVYKDHPVLNGVRNFASPYSLYKTSPIASDAKLLLTGKTIEGEQPVAWTRKNHGGRVVYIGLGGVQDWLNADFVKLVTNALFWAGDYKVKKK
ncbi:MAG: ThuA domain-containing protein [Chitinophagaceae bacterium]